MELRVEELAAQSGISVDTIRFYQGRGLLAPPSRRGRVAIYDAGHLARLREIRRRLDEGFTLAQIARLGASETLAGDAHAGDGRAKLLAALVEENRSERSYSLAELAAESGMPEPLIGAVQSAGLLAPVTNADGEERFSEADLAMLRAGLSILGQGFPLQELLALATAHANHVQSLSDQAIEMFDRHVRKTGSADDDAVAESFRALLPQATRLVALHFQRTLVNRALERLRHHGDDHGLVKALAATENAHLEVEWR